MRALALAGLSMLLVGGCAQTWATSSAEGTRILGEIIDYGWRVREKRRQVEAMCWRSVMREVEAMQADKEKTEADVRAFLLTVYPRPASVEIIQALDDPEGILALPPGCPDEAPDRGQGGGGETIPIGPPLEGELVAPEPIV